jgi:hypothetical protein
MLIKLVKAKGWYVYFYSRRSDQYIKGDQFVFYLVFVNKL